MYAKTAFLKQEAGTAFENPVLSVQKHTILEVPHFMGFATASANPNAVTVPERSHFGACGHVCRHMCAENSCSLRK